MGNEIHCVKIGQGKKVILGWSQMHGNESTTTKALFDLFKFLGQEDRFQGEIGRFLKEYTLYLIPMLNPDGAAAYTRENANGFDLNRDAKELSQAESRVLRDFFDEINPDLCLNLHDQRTLYSLPGDKCATVSFLAPSADAERSLTTARRIAMEYIVRMATVLEELISGQIGRYDDSFNENCVGDTFQMKGVPTILFEAGHFPQDYQRERTREYIFYAFLCMLGFIETKEPVEHVEYFRIPENEKGFRDVILRNVLLEKRLVSVAIRLEETLHGDAIRFSPLIEEVGDLDHLAGLEEIDVGGAQILLNCYENVIVNEKVVSIVDKNATNRVFYRDSYSDI